MSTQAAIRAGQDGERRCRASGIDEGMPLFRCQFGPARTTPCLGCPTLAPWGVFDTADRCWLGNAEGPLQYEDRRENGFHWSGEDQARAAATIANARFETTTRFRAAQFDVIPDKLRDVVTPPLTADEAMRRLGA